MVLADETTDTTNRAPISDQLLRYSAVVFLPKAYHSEGKLLLVFFLNFSFSCFQIQIDFTAGIRLRLRNIHHHSHPLAVCLNLLVVVAMVLVTVVAEEVLAQHLFLLHPSFIHGIWARMSIHSRLATFCHAI